MRGTQHGTQKEAGEELWGRDFQGSVWSQNSARARIKRLQTEQWLFAQRAALQRRHRREEAQEEERRLARKLQQEELELASALARALDDAQLEEEEGTPEFPAQTSNPDGAYVEYGAPSATVIRTLGFGQEQVGGGQDTTHAAPGMDSRQPPEVGGGHPKGEHGLVTVGPPSRGLGSLLEREEGCHGQGARPKTTREAQVEAECLARKQQQEDLELAAVLARAQDDAQLEEEEEEEAAEPPSRMDDLEGSRVEYGAPAAAVVQTLDFEQERVMGSQGEPQVPPGTDSRRPMEASGMHSSGGQGLVTVGLPSQELGNPLEQERGGRGQGNEPKDTQEAAGRDLGQPSGELGEAKRSSPPRPGAAQGPMLQQDAALHHSVKKGTDTPLAGGVEQLLHERGPQADGAAGWRKVQPPRKDIMALHTAAKAAFSTPQAKAVSGLKLPPQNAYQALAARLGKSRLKRPPAETPVRGHSGPAPEPKDGQAADPSAANAAPRKRKRYIVVDAEVGFKTPGPHQPPPRHQPLPSTISLRRKGASQGQEGDVTVIRPAIREPWETPAPATLDWAVHDSTMWQAVMNEQWDRGSLGMPAEAAAYGDVRRYLPEEGGSQDLPARGAAHLGPLRQQAGYVNEPVGAGQLAQLEEEEGTPEFPDQPSSSEGAYVWYGAPSDPVVQTIAFGHEKVERHQNTAQAVPGIDSHQPPTTRGWRRKTRGRSRVDHGSSILPRAQ